MRLVLEPAPDGHDLAQNWQVRGQKTTAHTSKQAARRELNSRATEGDTKVIKGTDGEILQTVTHRGGQSSTEQNPPAFVPHGARTVDAALPDMFK